VLVGGAHWRNLANMTELSMRGSNAAFLSNYFDHLFTAVTDVGDLVCREQCPSIKSPVVNEDRIRPGHWLGLVI